MKAFRLPATGKDFTAALLRWSVAGFILSTPLERGVLHVASFKSSSAMIILRTSVVPAPISKSLIVR